jgi:predicted MFS family arabinose efflux permease
VLAFASTFLGVPLLTFLPVFTKNVFHGDVGLYSRMMACSGVGAIAGALVVAWLGRFRHMGITAMLLQVLAGMLILAFTLTQSVSVSYVLLLVIGAAIMITYSLYTSLTQLIVPNELRGRVMSVYMLAFRGGMPLGSLVTGFLVDQAGAPRAIAGNAVLLSAVAIWFLVRHRTFVDRHTS